MIQREESAMNGIARHSTVATVHQASNVTNGNPSRRTQDIWDETILNAKKALKREELENVANISDQQTLSGTSKKMYLNPPRRLKGAVPHTRTMH